MPEAAGGNAAKLYTPSVLALSVELAAYQMVMGWIAIPFVISLGISEAAMVRVAYFVGARDPAAARTAMREHFQRLFEAMISATEHTALEEVRRRIGEDRKRFLATTQI